MAMSPGPGPQDPATFREVEEDLPPEKRPRYKQEADPDMGNHYPEPGHYPAPGPAYWAQLQGDDREPEWRPPAGSRTSEDMQLQPAPRKRRRIFRWVFLGIQVFFLGWVIAGIAGTVGSCSGKVGDTLRACQAGAEVGGTIEFTLVVFLWLAVDVIVGISWLIFRKRS